MLKILKKSVNTIRNTILHTILFEMYGWKKKLNIQNHITYIFYISGAGECNIIIIVQKAMVMGLYNFIACH